MNRYPEMTLRNLDEHTDAQIVGEVFQRLIEQGGPSIRETDRVCLYRGPEGRMCGIGMLISDEDYKPTMEGNPASYLPFRSVKGFHERGRLLDAIQEVHDHAALELAEGGASDWGDALRAAAEDYEIDERFGLEVPA